MGAVIDISNWQSWMLGQFSAVRAAGVDEAIVGCQVPSIALAQIDQCRANGIRVRSVYCFIYNGFNGNHGTLDLIARETQKAIDVARAKDIAWVAIDCEAMLGDNPSADTERRYPACSPNERIEDIRRAVKMVQDAGLKPFIYTGGFWWPTYVNNTTEFSHLPLWIAWYRDNSGTYSEIREAWFGGWNLVSIHQWTSTRKILLNNVDHNTIFIDFMGEDDMPDPRTDQLTKILGGQGLVDEWDKKGNSLLVGFKILQDDVGALAARSTELTNSQNSIVVQLADMSKKMDTILEQIAAAGSATEAVAKMKTAAAAVAKEFTELAAGIDKIEVKS